MESRMVKGEFQNRFGISSEKAINYIKSFFDKQLAEFKLIGEFDKSIYYGVKTL